MKNISNLVKMNFSNAMSVKKAVLPLLILFLILGSIMSAYLNILIPLFTYMMAYQIIAIEDKNNINILISNLPVKRTDFVKSRYIMYLICIVIGILYFSIAFFIQYAINSDTLTIGAIFETSTIYNNQKFHVYLMMIFSGIISSLFVMSILVPVTFKYAIEKTRIVVMFIIMIPLTVVGIILPDGIANIDIFFSHIIVTMCIGIIIIGVMTYISYLVSKKIYLNKEI
ncbi:MAG: ABC-2 transporter permease [Clostridioides sp.]|nr:ABC-2 transporter permease [Clostridioides sp.]